MRLEVVVTVLRYCVCEVEVKMLDCDANNVEWKNTPLTLKAINAQTLQPVNFKARAKGVNKSFGGESSLFCTGKNDLFEVSLDITESETFQQVFFSAVMSGSEAISNTVDILRYKMRLVGMRLNDDIENYEVKKDVATGAHKHFINNDSARVKPLLKIIDLKSDAGDKYSKESIDKFISQMDSRLLFSNGTEISYFVQGIEKKLTHIEYPLKTKAKKKRGSSTKTRKIIIEHKSEFRKNIDSESGPVITASYRINLLSRHSFLRQHNMDGHDFTILISHPLAKSVYTDAIHVLSKFHRKNYVDNNKACVIWGLVSNDPESHFLRSGIRKVHDFPVPHSYQFDSSSQAPNHLAKLRAAHKRSIKDVDDSRSLSKQRRTLSSLGAKFPSADVDKLLQECNISSNGTIKWGRNACATGSTSGDCSGMSKNLASGLPAASASLSCNASSSFQTKDGETCVHCTESNSYASETDESRNRSSVGQVPSSSSVTPSFSSSSSSLLDVLSAFITKDGEGNSSVVASDSTDIPSFSSATDSSLLDMLATYVTSSSIASTMNASSSTLATTHALSGITSSDIPTFSTATSSSPADMTKDGGHDCLFSAVKGANLPHYPSTAHGIPQSPLERVSSVNNADIPSFSLATSSSLLELCQILSSSITNNGSTGPNMAPFPATLPIHKESPSSGSEIPTFSSGSSSSFLSVQTER